MHIDKYTKDTQKKYCICVLAEQGKLTQELFNQIQSGSVDRMREVYLDQQKRIKERAELIVNPVDKKITLTQIDSIQEVLDALEEILMA